MDSVKTIIRNLVKSSTNTDELFNVLNFLCDNKLKITDVSEPNASNLFCWDIEGVKYIFKVNYEDKQVIFMDEPTEQSTSILEDIKNTKPLKWDSLINPQIEHTIYSGSNSIYDRTEVKFNTHKYPKFEYHSNNNSNNKTCVDNFDKLYCYKDNQIEPVKFYNHQKYVLDCLRDNKHVIIAKGRQLGITSLLINYAIFSEFERVYIIVDNHNSIKYMNTIISKIRKIIDADNITLKNKSINIISQKDHQIFTDHTSLCIFDEPSYLYFNDITLKYILENSEKTIIASIPKIGTFFNKTYILNNNFFRINLPVNNKEILKSMYHYQDTKQSVFSELNAAVN